MIRPWRTLGVVTAIALLVLPGCAAGAGLGGVPGGGGGAGQQGEVLVEVQGVDPDRQEIHVRTEQGESGAVLFDQNTVVVYQQQQYPVTALERGDVVLMQLEQLDANRLYTPRVDVRQTVQERTGRPAPGQVVQLSGEVGRIDREGRSFELRTEQGLFTVVLPQEADAAMLDYYAGLETGSRVRVEGMRFEADGLALRRFL